jgi:DNA-binding response OmpR family regulator
MNTLFEPSPEKAISASGRWPTSPSRRVLLVGADARIRRLSAQVLTRSGYQMDAAEDGEEGWEVLHARSYDLLITDNNLPRLTGLELVKKLRFARMTLPVIMASESSGTEELNRNQWLQFAAVLLKPFTTDKLLVTVEEVLCASGSVRTRSGICLPMLSETWGRIQPTSHWGINE